MIGPLLVDNLHVAAGTTSILNGVSLSVSPGEVHAVMGPNGAGKTTFANALAGAPGLSVTSGAVHLGEDDITQWDPEDRSRAGLFLAFQYPQQIAGVSVINFLRQALSVREGGERSILELRVEIADWMARLGIDSTFADRHLNEGFSGGEKKRNEILQLALLEPRFAILDETDSGLDVDALVAVATGVNQVRVDRPNLGVVVITHYLRLLELLEPDHVHILIDGRIVASGGPELAAAVEAEGYEQWR